MDIQFSYKFFFFEGKKMSVKHTVRRQYSYLLTYNNKELCLPPLSKIYPDVLVQQIQIKKHSFEIVSVWRCLEYRSDRPVQWKLSQWNVKEDPLLFFFLLLLL